MLENLNTPLLIFAIGSFLLILLVGYDYFTYSPTLPVNYNITTKTTQCKEEPILKSK